MMFVHAGNFIAQRSREVFFIPEHHVHMRSDTAIDLLRFLLATKRLPKRWAKIQIVRNNRAMTMCCLHCFQCDLRGRRRERTENTAGVQPARAFFTENLVPIDLPRFEMRNSSV